MAKNKKKHLFYKKVLYILSNDTEVSLSFIAVSQIPSAGIIGGRGE
jgi:hypothetical protein